MSKVVHAVIVEAGDIAYNAGGEGEVLPRAMMIQFDNEEDVREAAKENLSVKLRWVESHNQIVIKECNDEN